MEEIKKFLKSGLTGKTHSEISYAFSIEMADRIKNLAIEGICGFTREKYFGSMGEYYKYKTTD